MSAIDPEKLADAIAYYDNDARPAAPQFYEILSAARAHLSTLPRVKEVEVWRVEAAQRTLLHTGEKVWHPQVFTYRSEIEARGTAERYDEAGSWRCTIVTGPHLQKVPA